MKFINSSYEHVGKSIKGLAVVMFILEAIGAIITGSIILIDWEEWWGALILFCGPFAALVISWFIYALGELVDKTKDNENNTRQILEVLRKGAKNQSKADNRSKNEPAPKSKKKAPDTELLDDLYNDDGFKCPSCGNFVYFGETKCKNCGEEFDVE